MCGAPVFLEGVDADLPFGGNVGVKDLGFERACESSEQLMGLNTSTQVQPYISGALQASRPQNNI